MAIVMTLIFVIVLEECFIKYFMSKEYTSVYLIVSERLSV